MDIKIVRQKNKVICVFIAIVKVVRDELDKLEC